MEFALRFSVSLSFFEGLERVYARSQRKVSQGHAYGYAWSQCKLSQGHAYGPLAAVFKQQVLVCQCSESV